MSGSLVRSRFAAIAAKVESPLGTDAIAGAPVLADLILGEATIRLNRQVVPDPRFSGALDILPGIPGGTQASVEISVPLRGSGVAGTAASWGRLLQACTMVETADPTGIPATAATAGTVNSATLASAFSAVGQAYRGLPLLLSGNPAEPRVSMVTNYTPGRVATFGETFGAALDTSSLVALPPHVAYRVTSDESAYKSVTIYVYKDGWLWKFVGCVGSVRVQLTTGGIAMLAFTMQGQFLGQGAAALPTALTAGTAVSPPIFKKGRSRLLGELARTSSLTFDLGVSVQQPADLSRRAADLPGAGGLSRRAHPPGRHLSDRCGAAPGTPRGRARPFAQQCRRSHCRDRRGRGRHH
ncbi:phage tail tube protein [Roseococcus pinisoli]|uniref:Uncharacterized protein n=1 Tax=Roseococcus pinisoli TaxID=2835040 RepID=A0ABS5QAS0_9PROT|nr:phage tail tube protein [Roseococcus pinisoli]MBS7810533.1 hypothetical protein [Roseococcus pinisoli]